jgi:hypothetical protein
MGDLRLDRWLLMTYRVPREPSAGRVYVWRKLKQLGAIAVQDAVWALPFNPRTQERFQWLATEIVELKGEATVWEAVLLYGNDGQSLKKQFLESIDAEYREIQAALKKKKHNLTTLSKRFQEAQSRDYFASKLGQQTREKLIKASGGESA